MEEASTRQTVDEHQMCVWDKDKTSAAEPATRHTVSYMNSHSGALPVSRQEVSLASEFG